MTHTDLIFTRRIKPKQIILTWSLCILGILMLFPFATSLRLPKNSFNLPPSFFPTEWRWDNYTFVFNAIPLMQFIVNSMKVVVTIVIIQLFFSSMCAYAFARLRFRGSNALFIYLIAGLMIPYQSISIAQFLIITKMGVVDSHLALILPYLANPFGIFLLRQSIMMTHQGLTGAVDSGHIGISFCLCPGLLLRLLRL
jgi:multiple sugar transport system permease protein